MSYNNNQRTDNGSNPQAVQNNIEITKTGRSYFDESMVHTTTGDMGALIPIDLFKCIIGDDLELGLSLYIDNTNPMVRPMLSRVRAYVHYYYSRCTDLWKGYQNFITTGRTGNISKTLPYQELKNLILLPNEEATFIHQVYDTGIQSLKNYLGYGWIQQTNAINTDNETGTYIYPYGYAKNQYRTLPVIPEDLREYQTIQNFGTRQNQKINVLPMVMYQRTYRDYYLNKNLTQNNKHWFPDDEDEFIIPYETNDQVICIGKDYSNNKGSIIPLNEENQTKNDYPVLGLLRYRQFRGDYFTEALPWQYRGTEPSMTSWAHEKWNNGDDFEINNKITGVGAIDNYTLQRNANGTPGQRSYTTKENTPNNAYGIQTAYTANQIRELFIMAEWKERMAKTNGDYNQMMLAQFGENPHIHDRTPTYIGGCVVDLNTSTVTQTSGDTEDTTLGQQGGRMSAIINTKIGNFHCPDNGYIMAILSIVPDVTYNAQGIDKTLRGNTTMAEEYFPLFANLAPQGILESEIYNYESESETTLFGWQERFANLKYRRNRNSGWMSVNPNQDNEYASRTWARNFATPPKLNNAFVTMAPPNIRRDMFSAPTEPMFLIQAASRVGAVRHIPYTSKQPTLNGYGM